MQNKQRGEYACAFLELLTFASGAWEGKPFRLQKWQRDAIREFYGTIEPDEGGESVRRYQYLYLEVPKKNGKTELAAGLGLYQLVADGEPNPQVYVVAADRENASICYNAMVGMVKQSAWLGKRVRLRPSRKTIELIDGSGFIRVLSSDAESKHGYNCSCVIFDELHAQPNRKLWDVMTFGSGSGRRQQVWIVLTTAGDDPDRNGIGWEIHEKCRKILAARDGTGDPAEDSPNWYPVMYGLSAMYTDDELETVDIYAPELWTKCNPSIGVTVPLKTIRQEAAEAKKSEAAERLFRWLRLNQWVATKTVGWLPLSLYDRTQWHIPALEERLKGNELRREMRRKLRNKYCYGGLDLSSTTDLSSFVLEFPRQPGLEQAVVLFWAWRPMEAIADAEDRDHVPYRDWQRAEYIRLCPGDMVDFDEIESTITEAAKTYRMRALGVDPYLSRMMSGRLMQAGLNVVEIPQGYRLSPAMKDLERMLRAGEIVHEHNTAARWCFGNVRCGVDGYENIKPMKNLSTGRIDMAVAWIIAHNTYMIGPDETLEMRIGAGEWRM